MWSSVVILMAQKYVCMIQQLRQEMAHLVFRRLLHVHFYTSAPHCPSRPPLLQAVYSEDVSKRSGNEPVVQALRELMKYEMAMLVTDEDDAKGTIRTDSGRRSSHDNVYQCHLLLTGLVRRWLCLSAGQAGHMSFLRTQASGLDKANAASPPTSGLKSGLYGWPSAHNLH